jgi:metal-responsive CopG/Arc/MetJ family transcriptional regulator
MKVKTSITLSEEVLREMDSMATPKKSRSEMIEYALVWYIKTRKKDQRELNDLELINRHADELNREAEDILEYQDIS